jgi:signal transduction histidine kinase
MSKAAVGVESGALKETTSLVEENLMTNIGLQARLYDISLKTGIVDLDAIKTEITEGGFNTRFLTDYYYRHQFISRVYFIDSAGGTVGRFPTGAGIDTATIPEYAAASQSVAGRWTPSYKDPQSNDEVITYLLPVTKGGARLGTVGVTVAVSKIFSEISPIDPSESSYVFIASPNGRTITSSDAIKKDFLLPAAAPSLDMLSSPVLKRANKFQAVQDTKDHQGVFTLNNGSQEKIVTYASIPTLGSKLFVVSPVGEIIQVQTEKARTLQQAVRNVGVRSLAYSLIIATFIVAIAYLLSKQVLIDPLAQLRTGIKALMSTNFSSRMQVRSHDELGELAEAFNVMAKNLQDSNMHLREEHDRLQASIDSLKLGFLMTDFNNKLLIINEAAKKLLSKKGVVIDDSAWDFDRVANAFGDSLPFPKVTKDCLREVSLEMEAINFGNSIFHIFAGPVLSKNIAGSHFAIGAVMLIEDITEQKVMERSKDEFFSIASHELRTPLTTIRGNSSMMLEIYGAELKDESLKLMLSDIYKSSVQLIGIVNDFLDVSRIEQGKTRYDFSAVNLEDIIEAVVYETAKSVNDKGIYVNTDTYTLQALPKVAADPDRLKQVFYNLIGNAVKFTEKGGITIDTEVKDGHVVVGVTDTGRGIPPESQKLLFHKFQQAGQSLLTRDTTRGTGLGLYISKLLMEGMGGSIELTKSVPGKGTTFTFKLQIASDENLKALQASPAATAQIDAATGLTMTSPVTDADAAPSPLLQPPTTHR